MLTVAFPRVPFWDPYCLISTLMTYFISSKKRSCLTMLMMISCVLLILIQLLSNMFSTRNLWWCVSGFVITRWSWTLKNARRWFSRESPMSIYHHLLKVLLYTSWYSWSVWANIEWFPEFGKHITKISKKVGKQLDALCRLKRISSFPTKLCLYNSFIMSHSRYSITVWSLIAKKWIGCTNEHRPLSIQWWVFSK